MNRYNQPVELLIEQPASTTSAIAKKKGVTPDTKPDTLKQQLKAAGIDVASIKASAAIKKPAKKSRKVTTSNKTIHVKTKVPDTEINPWDMAHLAAKATGSFVEPDFYNTFTIDRKIAAPSGKINANSFGAKSVAAKKVADDSGFDSDWPPAANTVWHLGDNFSQLKSAREAVANIPYPIRIAHFDTGYSLTHPCIPSAIRKHPLQRNFVDGETPADAHDPMKDGMLRMPGHGTGTVALLAGRKVKFGTDDGEFNDYLGGAYFAEIITCRIASSVVLIKTRAFAEALNYIVDLTKSGTPIHVVSMSMGGAPSKAWTKAVNAAYEAGITVVTAAGNHFNGLPTKHLVYPAKYGRVIAACGVTHDLRPYSHKKLGEMQGCYGPKKKMKKALAAFTPNVPWASISTKSFKFSGAGTSSATPQIAAAAAIYYRKYHKELDALEPWRRVEAIRHALYTSALKKLNPKVQGEYSEYFGNGILQANEALKIPVATDLPKTEEDDTPWFPILATIFKARNKKPSARLEMFNTELAQLVFNQPELAAIIDNDTKEYSRIGKSKWNKFADAVISHPESSIALKKYLAERRSLR